MTEPAYQPRYICQICEAVLTAETDKEFESLWERHRAEHAVEQAALEPDPLDLEMAQAKAKRDSETMERMFRNEADHADDLAKHFEGVSKIEKRLPQLIDFSFKMANAVGQWCKEKEYRTKALKGGTIFWTPVGDIAAEFLYDKFNISAPEEPDYLKRGYLRLPELNSKYPAVFELCMTLGDHLINICHNRRIERKRISFTNLHHFTNPNTGIDCWAFRILNHSKTLKASRFQF